MQDETLINVSVHHFVFSGKYGRNAGLPFLRPPLTAALLTLGKAHQVTLNASSLWDFHSYYIGSHVKVKFLLFCCNPTECYGW